MPLAASEANNAGARIAAGASLQRKVLNMDAALMNTLMASLTGVGQNLDVRA